MNHNYKFKSPEPFNFPSPELKQTYEDLAKRIRIDTAYRGMLEAAQNHMSQLTSTPPPRSLHPRQEGFIPHNKASS